MPKIVKYLSLFSGIIIMSFLIGYIVFAWQEPTGAPPTGANVAAPINTGAAEQRKVGGLTLGAVSLSIADGQLAAYEFIDANGTDWRIDPAGNSKFSGNVGIGTKNPVAKLQISGDITNTTFRPLSILMDSTDPSTYTAIIANSPDADFSYGLALGAMPSTNNGSNPLYPKDTFGSIGAYKFYQGSGITPGGYTNLILNRDGGKVGIGLNPRAPSGADYCGGASCSYFDPGSTLSVKGNLSVGNFAYATTAAPTDGMIVKGKVGIGTINPMANLQISGNITNNWQRPLYVQMDASAWDVFTAAFANALRYGVAMGAYNADTKGSISAYRFTDGYGATPVDLILNREGGNVGIGGGKNPLMTPGAKLDVRGSVRIGSGASVSGAVLCWTATNIIGRCSTAPNASGICTCNDIP